MHKAKRWAEEAKKITTKAKKDTKPDAGVEPATLRLDQSLLLEVKPKSLTLYRLS
jgi:hypothetical protein